MFLVLPPRMMNAFAVQTQASLLGYSLSVTAQPIVSFHDILLMLFIMIQSIILGADAPRAYTSGLEEIGGGKPGLPPSIINSHVLTELTVENRVYSS